VRVKDLTPNEWPWPLLLEADPSREVIETYIHQATVMGLVEEGTVVAVVVLLSRAPGVAEVMAIAVALSHRGQKLGKRLLAAAIDRAKQQGAQRMLVATGNSSLDQLAFYQKMGFRLQSIDRDYFVRTYPDPIFEHGIQCCDRVWLDREL
jgi:N-acetylglutamate synthase-like GNAT family acetyltransferase